MGPTRCIPIVVLAAIICMNIPIYSVSANENLIVSRGESFTISATLLSNGTSGEPLSNQLVYFYDQTMNTLMASTKTDSNGIASLDYIFPVTHPLGNTLVNITFMGNTTLALAPTCQWFTLTLTSLTRIELQTTKTELAPNDILEFSIHLTDDIDNPIDSANISILYDESPILETWTNETGDATISIPLSPAIFSIGHHTIEIRYEGDSIEFYRGTSVSFEIEINRISTNIEIVTVTESPTMLTQTWNATLQVLTEEGHITMEQSRILVDGTYYDSTIIDQDGYIRYSFFINQSFSIGEHTITIEYPGNERYSNSHVDLTISVGSSLLLDATPLQSAEIGQKLFLEITTLDVYSRPLTNGTLTVTDSSTNQSLSEGLSNQTTTIIQFPISGEKGPRIFLIQVTYENLLSNNTFYLNLDVWTKPKIEIISSNIKGFASPKQSISIDIRLQDYRGFLPDKTIVFHLSNTNETLSTITQLNGIARIEIQSPTNIGSYSLLINYNGNQSSFELPSHVEISFQVSQIIPIEVTLQDYEIIPPLSSILVRLQLQAFNGSYVEGILVQYRWIETEGNSPSNSDGITELQLPIPSTSGIHTLYYEVEPIGGLQACSGIIYIITTSEDANASQGVGFYGLIIGFTSSIGLSTITIVRRRLILG